MLIRYCPFSPSACAWGSVTDESADNDDGLVVCDLMLRCNRVCCRCGVFSSPECAASPSEESSTQVVSSRVTLNVRMVAVSSDLSSVELVCCAGVFIVGEGGEGGVWVIGGAVLFSSSRIEYRFCFLEPIGSWVSLLGICDVVRFMPLVTVFQWSEEPSVSVASVDLQVVPFCP